MFNKDYMHWTDMYRVVYSRGFIKIYISSYKDGSFLGTVLFDKSITDDTDFQQWSLKHFPEKSEEEAYRKCDEFINDFLEGKGGYNIETRIRTT
tara:strand:+ start:2016 stop:2297 length:282 start_codon:yes stop_codon:yes gene_type:complete